MSSTKVILGILGSVAVGAIAGILWAPAKGLKTRKKIVDKENDLRDDVKWKAEELYENLLQDTKEVVSNDGVK
jgi:gas vesicle protein